MLNAILVVTLLALAFGLLLGWAALRLRVQGEPLVEEINKLLPQTQCGQCGFPGCRPYAEAIARAEADINRCPPGGAAGIRTLAQLLNRDVLELDAERGVEKPKTVAWIDEAVCIGCTKCIQACPVDAIVGATKLMHTVIADHCTGCELCLPPCPVDCILLLPAATGIAAWRPAAPLHPALQSELR